MAASMGILDGHVAVQDVDRCIGREDSSQGQRGALALEDLCNYTPGSSSLYHHDPYQR